MDIRPASLADAEAIAHIRVAAWRAAYGRFMPAEFLSSLDPLPTVERLRDKLASDDSDFSVLVAEDDQGVVGFAMFGPPRYESGAGVIELWALNVLPTSWRAGTGRALTLRAIEFGRTQGKSMIELWCINDNLPAQSTYERCGFRRTGQERTTSELTGHPLHERLYALAL